MTGDIEVKNISKSFGEKPVLSGLSLTFKEGEMTCVMGPSGFGKTTLLRILAGLEQPDNGTVSCGGKTISFVFQEDRLCESFSAVSNIKVVTGKKLSDNSIEKLLAELGLADCANKPVRELSGGMKRRLAIARALCYEADLILMDEPFKGLDEKLKSEVMDIVKARTAGKTVIFVTHDQSEADHMGCRVIKLEEM